MNNEDKELIREYMGWETTVLNWWREDDSGIVLVDFDLNDAGLCAKEMKRRRDWADFVTHVEADTSKRFNTWSQLLAWLYDADNFFKAMAKWLREAEK
jgi:hypothetical protein